METVSNRTKSVLTVLICLGLVILAVVIMATAAQGAARFITTPIGYAPPKPAPVLTWRVTPVDMRVVKALRAPRPAPVAPTRLPDAGSVSSIWDCIFEKESGNQPLGCDPHCGRAQWLPSTWRAAGGTKYAALPQDATEAQEKEIAASWLAKTSWNQWPNTSRMCGAR